MRGLEQIFADLDARMRSIFADAEKRFREIQAEAEKELPPGATRTVETIIERRDGVVVSVTKKTVTTTVVKG